MTECNHVAFAFSNARKRRVRGDVSGGSISSNGGALLLREVDRKLGLTTKVARALGEQRQRGKVRRYARLLLMKGVADEDTAGELMGDFAVASQRGVVGTGFGRQSRRPPRSPYGVAVGVVGRGG